MRSRGFDGPRRPVQTLVERWIVTTFALDVDQWANENFGACDFGHARRTRRAVRFARQMAEHPDGSTPDQTENWAALKAGYRLLKRPEVTFQAVASPHWRRTREHASGTVLLIGDTTEIDFGIHRRVKGLGPTGDGRGRGFHLHNCLMVNPETAEIIGLAGQELFYRKPAPKGENSYRTSQRRGRESEVWGRLIAKIGPPAAGVRYIHTFDRGADNADVFCELERQQGDWVIRAAQLHRRVHLEQATGRGKRQPLREALAAQPVCGTYELEIRAAKDQPARRAKLAVRFARVTIPPTKRRTPLQRAVNFQGLTQWVVEAREIDPPRGVKAVCWVLWTSLPVENFDQAWQVLTYYEQRWLIEEFHKALKTGCQLESRQYQSAARLEKVAGFLSVLAVRLVKLKTIARTAPETPAEGTVPRRWLIVLRSLRRKPITTVRDFFRHLAGLGGFLMRKGDGEPGWITLWRGLDKLLLALRGYAAKVESIG